MTGDRGIEDDSSDDNRLEDDQPFKKRRLVAQPTIGWDKEDDINVNSVASAQTQSADPLAQGQEDDLNAATNVVIHDED